MWKKKLDQKIYFGTPFYSIFCQKIPENGHFLTPHQKLSEKLFLFNLRAVVRATGGMLCAAALPLLCSLSKIEGPLVPSLYRSGCDKTETFQFCLKAKMIVRQCIFDACVSEYEFEFNCWNNFECKILEIGDV